MKYFKPIVVFAILVAVLIDCSRGDLGPKAIPTCLLDSVQRSDGTANYYTYDVSNKLTGGSFIQGMNFPVTYIYNNLGQVTSIKEGQYYVFDYVYDNHGFLLQVTQEGWGRSLYTYNTSRQLSRIDFLLYDSVTSDFVLYVSYLWTFASTKTNNPSSLKLYDDTGMLLLTCTYEYDNKYYPSVPLGNSTNSLPTNNLKKVTTTMQSGTVKTTVYTYTYNSSGYPLTKHGEDSSGVITDEMYTYAKCF